MTLINIKLNKVWIIFLYFSLLFYIFFESILPPLFILIGIFGSDNRVKASFYLFLYTLVGEKCIFNFQCKRTKFRGSPKALVTKDVKETLYLA